MSSAWPPTRLAIAAGNARSQALATVRAEPSSHEPPEQIRFGHGLIVRHYLEQAPRDDVEGPPRHAAAYRGGDRAQPDGAVSLRRLFAGRRASAAQAARHGAALAGGHPGRG